MRRKKIGDYDISRRKNRDEDSRRKRSRGGVRNEEEKGDCDVNRKIKEGSRNSMGEVRKKKRAEDRRRKGGKGGG